MVFLGDIAFYMATLIFAVGIWMIHHASYHAEKPSKLLKNGGYIVLVISLLGMLCTGYYWLKYFSQGAFDSPHSIQTVMNKNGKMGTVQNCMGQMEGKVMDSSMMSKMRNCMMMDSSEKND